MRLIYMYSRQGSLRRLLYGLLLLLVTFVAPAQAQTAKKITGIIVADADGTTLPGASVTVKGTNQGTVTDAEGRFLVTVPSSQATLVISLIGYGAQEVVAGTQTTLNIRLKEDVAVLNEVVVVGYGQQKKLNLTGAVETIRFDEAVNLPVTNSSQLMYGRFSGVQLTQSSGLPGADASSINIRGIGTFGSSTPLVVIDNIQYSGLTEFNNLSPSDIESISVLKDASASAIYGARGANGVIVVTTKKGKSGKLTVDYNAYTGFQRVTVVPQYLDALTYATLRNERDRNANGPTAPLRYSDQVLEAIRTGSQPDQYANTNWARETLRDAPIQNHYLSFSGGSDNLTYRVSLGYLNQQAIVRGKFKSERYTLGLNLSTKANRVAHHQQCDECLLVDVQGAIGRGRRHYGRNGHHQPVSAVVAHHPGLLLNWRVWHCRWGVQECQLLLSEHQPAVNRHPGRQSAGSHQRQRAHWGVGPAGDRTDRRNQR